MSQTCHAANSRYVPLSVLVITLSAVCADAGAQCQPDMAGSVTPPGVDGVVLVSGVAVSGNTMYVGTHYGLALYDLTDPTSPTYISHLGDPLKDHVEPMHLVASDTTVFAANFTEEVFRSYDVSDPQNPVALDSLDFDIGWNGKMALSGDIVFAAGDSAVRIVDASDPADLIFVTSIGQPHLSSARDVAAAGDVIYIAAGDAGLLIFDVSDPANPALLSTLSDLASVSGVAVEGDIAYVAETSDDTLNLIDVADPMNPTIISSVSTVEFPSGDVAVENGTAFVVTNYGGDSHKAAQSFDVSDPAEPVWTGTAAVIDGSGHFVQVARHGPFTFLAINTYMSGPVLVVRDPCYAGYGACCVGDGCLAMMTESPCASVGGTFLGAGSSCADPDCPDPEPDCPADLTGDGVVDVSDLFELLSAWGPCS